MKGLYCDNYDCKNFGVNLLENNPETNKCCKRVIELHYLVTTKVTFFQTVMLLVAHHIKNSEAGIKPTPKAELPAMVLINHGLMEQISGNYHLTANGRFCANWLIDNDKEAEKFYYGL